MADIVSNAVRSRMMSGIRSANTKPETIIRSALHRRGYRFRIHRRDLPGNPDVVLPKYRSVIFVNGCFWHGHTCSSFKWPKTRAEFWRNKIGRNKLNDIKVCQALLDKGWRVAIVWECSIRGAKKDATKIIGQIETWLRCDLPFIEIPQ
jgi:DNA mismatch endonuclease (patch repair protein)